MLCSLKRGKLRKGSKDDLPKVSPSFDSMRCRGGTDHEKKAHGSELSPRKEREETA